MIILISTLLACAAHPPPPAPGQSQIWGHVRVVPREGVHATSSHGNAYGDRRLRDVSLVDYASPGIAVVFVDEGPTPTESAALTIRASRVGTAIEPAFVALGAAGHLSIRNESPTHHVLSYPATELVVALEPNEAVDVEVVRPGEQALFLLDAPEATAMIFAAPGPFSEVSASGRFVLPDVSPGEHRIHAWHRRFPPASEVVELRPDAVLQIDFELGVGREAGTPHAH